MSKQVLFNEEAKDALQKGISKVAEAVGSTMGACGKTVVISNYHGAHPVVTKDGITVAACIQLDDEIENTGAMMIRQGCKKTADDAGDGTTQTAVLAQELIRTGLAAVKNGANPQDLKAGIDCAVEDVVMILNDMAIKVGEDNDKVYQIATTSANNDTVIGRLIADAYKKIGYAPEGLLLIEESGITESSIQVVESIEFPRGYAAPEFINNQDKMKVIHDAPLILVADYTISSMKQLEPIIGKIHAAGLIQHPIIIIANDYEGEAYSAMILNNLKKIIKCCLIKLPGEYRGQVMEDIAVATGATLIRDQSGLKMEDAEVSHLGSAVKIVVSERKTEIFAGSNNPVLMEEHKNAIKTIMADMKDEALLEVYKKRLAMLSGSVGVISVGGATNVEMKERKDRVDDACRAVRSAIEEGYVAGGGVALVRCHNSLAPTMDSFPKSFIKGYDIVRALCVTPIAVMLKNAGLQDSDVFMEVVNATGNIGYNIKTNQHTDLIEAGIIDPVKVIRCALQNAASVAGAVITSDCLIIEMKPKA